MNQIKEFEKKLEARFADKGVSDKIEVKHGSYSGYVQRLGKGIISTPGWQPDSSEMQSQEYQDFLQKLKEAEEQLPSYKELQEVKNEN